MFIQYAHWAIFLPLTIFGGLITLVLVGIFFSVLINGYGIAWKSSRKVSKKWTHLVASLAFMAGFNVLVGCAALFFASLTEHFIGMLR